jgi:hypothetical protein
MSTYVLKSCALIKQPHVGETSGLADQRDVGQTACSAVFIAASKTPFPRPKQKKTIFITSVNLLNVTVDSVKS